MALNLCRRELLLGALGAGLGAKAWAAAPALELGVTPNISPRVLLAQYEPMREYLGQSLQQTVQVSTAPNWASFLQRSLALEYELVVAPANLARVLQLDAGFAPLVAYAPQVPGLILHAIERPLAQVRALAGQALALSNPASLVVLQGMQWLEKQALVRDRDFRTLIAQGDDSVGSLVLRGAAAAAMCSGGEFRAIPEPLKSQLAVFTRFAEVPSFVVLASPRMAAARAQLVKDALLAFGAGTPQGNEFFASTGFTGIRKLGPGHWDGVDPYLDATRKALSP